MANRPAKRVRVDIHHQRVVFNNDLDYTTLTSREERSVPVHQRPIIAHRTEFRGDTSWIDGATWQPPSVDDQYGLPNEAAWFDEEVTAMAHTEKPAKRKRVKSTVSRRPNVSWKKKHRQTYLDELLRWEGRGDVRRVDECPDCVMGKAEQGNEGPGKPEYCCVDCFVPDLVCSLCCARRHRQNPLHRIKKWNGTFFETAWLKDTDLKVQLGHVSLRCSNPVPCAVSMKVLHTNGIHNVAFLYCGCERAVPQHIQLLRRGFYPSTQSTPQTCATFALLRQLHSIALTSKASTYDFYRALEKLTDGTGVGATQSRYRALMRMLIQWRHLKLLKRAGRGHDPEGVEKTKDGELVVPCLTCPRPGVNLPEGWEKASESERFLYQLVLCVDANFRLKNQLVSTYSADPGLGIGWAYMVPRQEYEQYVLSQANADDVSTCVGFSALAKANTRFSRGMRYTGVGAVVCGRSEMFLPCGVGNLIKGERYCNMDIIVAFYLRYMITTFYMRLVIALWILISYDVACQWFVNLRNRMLQWPESHRIPSSTLIRPAIPKMHETAHTRENHERLSLRYLKGVGLTDGEGIERMWAGHNALGNATKTTGPGTRHDVLDDNFGFWNWLKYIGKTLAKKFKAAVALHNLQKDAHAGFTATMPEDRVQEWERTCEKWENEPWPKMKSKNPYAVEGSSISEAEVRKELAKEEEARLKSGGVAYHSTSASAFIALGLELEEEQRKVSNLAKRGGTGATQKATLAEQRASLRQKIKSWEAVQSVYMPGLLQYQLDNPITLPSDNPDDIPLSFPSSIPLLKRPAVCSAGLAQVEEKLRTAQCHDALENIRQTLNMKSRMVHFKNANIRGQRDGTRSRAIIDRVQDRAKLAAGKYSAARAAKLALCGPGPWEKELQVLRADDVRSYTDPERMREGPGRRGIVEDDAAEGLSSADPGPDPNDLANVDLLPQTYPKRGGTGETRRTMSWIWLSAKAGGGSDADNDDLLRSEWAKSRARVERAKEEVALLKEEMRRGLSSLRWRAQWWISQGEMRKATDGSLREGLKAYAEEQAHIQNLLHKQFQKLWTDPLSTSKANKTGENNDDDDDDDDNDDDDDENDDDDDDDDDVDEDDDDDDEHNDDP